MSVTPARPAAWPPELAGVARSSLGARFPSIREQRDRIIAADVASSVVEMGWAGNVFDGAKWWLDAESEWAEFQRSLARDRWIEVRYEDLIANSEAQLRRVCALIGVPFSERMFDYTESSSYSLPDPTQASKWRRKVPPRDLELLEARIGAQLAARGYELSCTVPPRIGPGRVKWIGWRSRVKLLQRKIERFGFWLCALEFTSRRLGWTAVNSKARSAIDTIIDRNLK
jgi:Sulfotransferase family